MNWSDFLSVEKRLTVNKNDFKNDPTYVGIDFGTSTTIVSIASLNKDGKLSVKNIDIPQKKFNGASITDHRVNSAVAYYKGKLLFGAGAKEIRSKTKQNINYWESFKMSLGTDVGVAYPESSLELIKNPSDVTILFFKALKNAINNFVSKNELNKEIKYTITIPASFESHHRRDLVKCLKAADITIEESGLIDEPNAAFISYSFLPNENSNELFISDEYNPNVLIFDFGAGTCDISIVEIGQNTNGIFTKNISLSQFAEIGGDNFDKIIAEKILLPELLKQSNFKKNDFRIKEINHDILPHLKDLGEKLKIQVSERIEVFHEIITLPESELTEQKWFVATTKKINSRLGELHIHNPEINLKEFIEISEIFNFSGELRNQYFDINPVFSALGKAKLNSDDIDFVLFIGGSTKNFIIREKIKAIFRNAIALEPKDPQSHVSNGAAIHSLLLHKFDTQIIRPITNQDIFTKIFLSGKEHKITLINAGEPVPFPTKTFDQFQPAKNGQQTIEIPFFTGSKEIELEKIVLKSCNPTGFTTSDKIHLSLDVNLNKVLIINASINDINTTLKIENPFVSGGKNIVSKDIRNALKSFNIESSNNAGKPSIQTYKNLINTYEKNEEFLSAAELLEEAVDRYNQKDEYNNLNLLYSKAGNSEKAKFYAEKALERDPSDPILLFNLASKLRYQQPQKAIELLKISHELNPNSPTTLYLLGDLLNNKEGKDLKIKAFNIWQTKLINDNMESWDYSWFSNCAWDLNEHEVYREIIDKEKDNKRQHEGFYDPNNLMGISKNNSKKH